MSREHSVIIIPGLGGKVKTMKLATNHWFKYGLKPIVYSMDWYDKQVNFQSKLNQLIQLIDELNYQGDVVSLVGTSAGGSAAGNAFVERKGSIHRVINVCGRLRTGPQTGFRSFVAKTVSSPSFASSVKLFESKEHILLDEDRQKIMTVKALLGDELVPKSTIALKGARNISILTIGHMFSIGMALTAFSSPLISFLSEGVQKGNKVK